MQDTNLGTHQLNQLYDPANPSNSIVAAAERARARRAEQSLAAKEEIQPDNQEVRQPAPLAYPGDTPVSTEGSAESVGGVSSPSAAQAPPPAEPEVEMFSDAYMQQQAEFMRAQGNTELADKIASPQVQGAIQVTSPVEFIATAGTASGMIGGAKGLMLMATTAPVEYAGTIYAEEIAEDNMAVGLISELAFGVFTGMAGQKVIDGITNLVKKTFFNTAGRSNVATKNATLRAAKFDADMKMGDLNNSDVRDAYAEMITAARAEGNLTSQQALDLSLLEIKVEQARGVVKKAAKDKADAQLDNLAQVQGYPDHATGVLKNLDEPAFESSKARVSKRVSRAVRDRANAEWYGPVEESWKTSVANARKDLIEAGYDPAQAEKVAKRRLAKGHLGSNFQSDLKTATEDAIAKAKASGEEFNMAKLKRQVKVDLEKQYSQGIAESTTLGLAKVDPNSFAATNTEFVKGTDKHLGAPWGGEGPEGGISTRAATEGGQSRYQYDDWDIMDHASMGKLNDADVLQYSSTPIPPPQRPQPTAKASKIFDFVAIGNRKEADFAMKKFIQAHQDPKIVAKTARSMKIDTEVFSAKKGELITIKALPDDEVDAVARIFGWNESKLISDPPIKSPAQMEAMSPEQIASYQESLTKYATLPEDIVAGRNLFKEYEVTSPGYFKGQAALDPTKEARDPKYYKMLGQEKYRKQREAFLKQALGGVEGKAFYQKLDSIAVMRNALVNDVKRLDGGPLQNYAKRMMLLFDDTLSGSDKMGNVNTLSQARVRDLAYQEIVEHQSGKPSEIQTEIAIQRIMDEEGISFDKAADEYADRLLTENPVDEIAEAGGGGVPRGADDETVGYKNVGDDQQLDEFNRGPQTPEQIFNNLSDPDRILIAKQVEQIEQHMGVRVSDDLYSPSVVGQSGRMNLFRVNTVDDITEMIQSFERLLPGPDGEQMRLSDILDNMIPEEVIGVKDFAGHSQDNVNRMTYMIQDVQAQMGAVAGKVVENPDSITGAVAFEKLSAINKVLLSQLADGKPSENSLAALARMNFSAPDDAGTLERMVSAVDTNYNIFAKTGADTRQTMAMAQMYNDMPDSVARGKFMYNMSHVDDYTQITKQAMEMKAGRQAAMTKFREAGCVK